MGIMERSLGLRRLHLDGFPAFHFRSIFLKNCLFNTASSLFAYCADQSPQLCHNQNDNNRSVWNHPSVILYHTAVLKDDCVRMKQLRMVILLFDHRLHLLLCMQTFCPEKKKKVIGPTVSPVRSYQLEKHISSCSGPPAFLWWFLSSDEQCDGRRRTIQMSSHF